MQKNTDWVVDAHRKSTDTHRKSTDQYDGEIARSFQHDFAYAAFKYAVSNYPHMNFRLRQGWIIALNSALGHGR